jgi:nucleotide-binding universal stress UspA family protein
MFDRILVPLDGSEQAAAALPVAADLARHYQATLVLVQVVTPDDAWREELFREITGGAEVLDLEERAVEAARRHLERVVADLRPLPAELEVRLGRPAEAIVQAAQETRCGLICMAAHGHGRGALRHHPGLPAPHPVHWMLGGVTDRVAHTSPVPVLIVRPRP